MEKIFGHLPRRILVPQSGMEPVAPALRVLTTGPPGKSQKSLSFEIGPPLGSSPVQDTHFTSLSLNFSSRKQEILLLPPGVAVRITLNIDAYVKPSN